MLTDRPAPPLSKLRYIAFYLPQYHPIPENDRWWGKGFTEWTNVTKAKPLFAGHNQPQLPSELGFYDLRVRETQRHQISLAKEHGIDAFCFHYYWFNGKKLLERPLMDFLADESAHIDFCISWANHKWTRKWDTADHEILMDHDFSAENDLKFIEDAIPLFQDRRYVRVNGAPLLVVFCPHLLPNPTETSRIWREHCRKVGIGEIHLVAALTEDNKDFESLGFDAGVDFPPHNPYDDQGNWPKNLADNVGSAEKLTGAVWDYNDFSRKYLKKSYAKRRIYRTVVPDWDNTARMGPRAFILTGGKPENYERWLSEASFQTIADRSPGERIVFINAWNEWAEGCHLEPCRHFGRGFLEATQRVKSGRSVGAPASEGGYAAGRPRSPASADAWRTHPDVPLVTRLAIRTSNALRDHPAIYGTARALYRATLKGFRR